MTAVAYTSGTAIATRMGITDSNSTAVLAAIGTAVNALVEGYIGVPVGPGGTASRTFDGDGGDVLFIRHGVNGISTLEIADETGGTFSTLASTEYALRPLSYDRPDGWPAFRVYLTDKATTYGAFTQGWETVRITPSSEGWGWAAIPEDLKQVAIVLGTRMYQARQSGETLIIGATDFGAAIARFLPEPEYRAVLDRYKQVVAHSLVG